MYIEDRLSVIERVFLRKIVQRKHVLLFFFVFFLVFFAKFTSSAKMRHVEKSFFEYNI